MCLSLLYSGAPFERPPRREVTPSGKATWQCKSKHNCMDFFPWWKATLLERPLFWCKQGGLTRGVPLYIIFKRKTEIYAKQISSLKLSISVHIQITKTLIFFSYFLNYPLFQKMRYQDNLKSRSNQKTQQRENVIMHVDAGRSNSHIDQCITHRT